MKVVLYSGSSSSTRFALRMASCKSNTKSFTLSGNRKSSDCVSSLFCGVDALAEAESKRAWGQERQRQTERQTPTHTHIERKREREEEDETND